MTKTRQPNKETEAPKAVADVSEKNELAVAAKKTVRLTNTKQPVYYGSSDIIDPFD